MYIDVYFVSNWLLDGWILTCAASSCQIARWRIWLSAAAGALGACIWEVANLPELLRPVGALALSAAMVFLCLGLRPKRQVGQTLFRLYAYSFLMAGLIPVASRYIPLWIGSVSLSYAGLKLLVRFSAAKRKRKVVVTIRSGEKEWRLAALVDSGNLLKDPMKGKPVIIVKEESLPARPAAEWPILYQTIQGQGLMMGFWPETIEAEGFVFKEGEVIVGLSREWKDEGYEAIVPESILG